MIIDQRDISRIRTFGLAMCGLYITKGLLENYMGNSIFNSWRLIIMIGIWLSGFLFFFLKERDDFIKTRKLKNFTSTFVGITIIVINIGLYFYMM